MFSSQEDVIPPSMKQERFKVFEAQDSESGYFDVTFDVEGKLIHAHKFVLASVSTTFKAMFSERWNVNHKPYEPITVQEYKYDDFYRFLIFIYSETCALDDETIFIMADMSEFYNVAMLRIECCAYLRKIVSKKLISFYERLCIYPTFKESLRSVLQLGYPAILDYEDIANVKKETIEEIVSLERSFKYEAKLFKTVCEWAENQASLKRQESNAAKFNFQNAIKDEFADLLPRICFRAMEDSFLKNDVVRKGFIFSSFEEVSDILTNAHKYKIEITDLNGHKLTGTLKDEKYFAIDKLKKFNDLKSDQESDKLIGWHTASGSFVVHLVRKYGTYRLDIRSQHIRRPPSPLSFESDRDDYESEGCCSECDGYSFDITMEAEDGFEMKDCKIHVFF
uniref:BTB domain-containing protein n=1 Tax=Panagrolaimus sp. ES5 TaxID=591445 RepID=A0AC34FC92_9BILA